MGMDVDNLAGPHSGCQTIVRDEQTVGPGNADELGRARPVFGGWPSRKFEEGRAFGQNGSVDRNVGR
jgi:hypothetical protein